MAFNPNAVFISPSSLADFEKCPQLYYYRNVYRTPRGLKIQLVNPALALGQAVHDTLESFLKLPVPERTQVKLLEIFAGVWSNFLGDKGGFADATQEGNHKSRGLAMLDRFWAHPHFKSSLMAKIPSFPKTDLGPDLILTGKLDWLEASAGGGLHIVDFKTGKNEEKDDSPQLPIYAVLVSGIFNATNITSSYWYLDKDADLVSFTLPDLAQTRAMLIQKGELVKMIRQTQSFRCQSGGDSCWACRDMVTIAHGGGKLVTVDPVSRKQEIYILPKVTYAPAASLPF